MGTSVSPWFKAPEKPADLEKAVSKVWLDGICRPRHSPHIRPSFSELTQCRGDISPLSPSNRGSIYSRMASRSVGFPKWTVLIGRTGFDTIPWIPDPTLSLNATL